MRCGSRATCAAPGDGGVTPGPPETDATASPALERAWWVLSRWAVPVMMTIAYGFLAAIADTTLTGKAWMMGGLVLVMIVWFVFRGLTEAAALSRALGVGDPARLFALADRHLAHQRRPSARAPFVVGRGLAHLLRGEHREALVALDAAEPGPELAALAAAVRIVALVELERPADEARALRVPAPRTPALAGLADGAIAWRAGELDAASQVLARVISDVRAGSATRAVAHVYAARIAAARGDAPGAARHRAAAAALATPDASWLRR